MDQCPWPLPLVGAVRDEAAVAGVDASLSAAGADRALLSLIEGHEAASTGVPPGGRDALCANKTKKTP